MSNSEKSCYVCGEDVVNEDDYKTHLSIAHGKNYGNKTTSFSSDMTLEENSEDFEESLITQTTEKPAEEVSYDRDGGNELSSFCNEFDARLKEIQDLVDGKVELAADDNNLTPPASDDQIWQMFEDIKHKIMSIDIPVKGSEKNIETCNFDEVNTSCKTQEPKIAVKKESKSEPVKSFDKPNPTLHAENPKSNNTFEVKRDIKPQSFFYCPIDGCTFSTTKTGMKTGKAAVHLKDDHEIKAKDMKPGMYKFTKIKV